MHEGGSVRSRTEDKAYATVRNGIKENRRPEGHLRTFFTTAPVHGFLQWESGSRRFMLLQQPIKLFAHDAVALAGDSLQAFAIYDRDQATRIFD
jgi:hypothetical protein